MAKTGCKPAAVKMLLYGSYRKALDNQPYFVAKERLILILMSKKNEDKQSF
jgi:hypothetical protein